ncbi:MAG: hypothetical protein WCP17_00890 [bacterium]
MQKRKTWRMAETDGKVEETKKRWLSPWRVVAAKARNTTERVRWFRSSKKAR